MSDKAREREEQRIEEEKWAQEKGKEMLKGVDYRLHGLKSNYKQSGVFEGSIGQMSSYSGLPQLGLQKVKSVANIRGPLLRGNKRSLVRLPPEKIQGIPKSGSLPQLVRPKTESSGPPLPSTLSKLVRINSNATIMGEEEIQEEDDGRKLCPQGCGRKFGEDVLEKHMDICRKVFTGARVPFDSAKYRWRKTFKK